jgi:3-phosphoshikimate 1-carboxyvinyltransferase
VTAFGGSVDWDDDAGRARVEGFDGRPETPADVVDCGNSGTTMRLTAAAGALADGLVVLTGDESLRSRPQGPLLAAVESLGGRADSTRANGQAPLVVGRGESLVDGGRVSIPGDVSSQFVTALLMAGAVTDDGIAVELTTPLRSAPYVAITTELLDAFGVAASRTDAGYAVEGGAYRAGSYEVPADFSSGSYLLAAGAVAGEGGVTVEGLRPGPQGDSAIVDLLGRMGAGIEWDRSAGRIDVVWGELAGVEVSVADTPDLLPTVAALGAAADGDTRIVDCEHVRHKETDRVSVMATELERMGAAVTETHGALTVHGDDSELVGATVDGRADHRIVMALAVAALAASGPTTIRGAEHVDVSFPGFFEALAGLGVDVHGA